MKREETESTMVKKTIARITAIIGASIVVACIAASIYHIQDEKNFYCCIAACGGLIIFGGAMEWMDIQKANNQENK